MGAGALRRPVPPRLPTDTEYRERHELREAERELACFCDGRPYNYRAFNRKEWPPYPKQKETTNE